MRIGRLWLCGLALCASTAGTVRAQTGGDEIVIPAGAFAKDGEGIAQEGGGFGGTGIQQGALKFPKNKIGISGTTVVGLTTLVPASWVGHEIDIVFGGSAASLLGDQFRIVGQVDDDLIGVTASLGSEDEGTTEVTLVSGHTVLQRRFGIAVGREPGHAGDAAGMWMNLEYLVLRLTN
jgi:hypothetical protein